MFVVGGIGIGVVDVNGGDGDSGDYLGLCGGLVGDF